MNQTRCMLALTMCVLLTSAVRICTAATFTCLAGDVACLIAAIHIANSTPQADTIQLAAGTYTLTAADNETSDGLNGLPVVTGQLTITGVTAESSTIERAPGAPAFRLLQVSASGALTLRRLTLRGGSAGFGTWRGGAIYSRGDVAIMESVLTGHSANSCCGAIVILDGRLTITNSHVKANRTASDIGAIGGDSATIVITASTIADNRATYHAGGLYAALGTLTVTGSTFTANVAGFHGAAIFNDRNTLTLANTTLAENVSGLRGGGLYNENGVGTLVNSTLADNWAEAGGGGFYNFNGAVELQNTIVARNASLFEGVDCDSPTTLITSLGHNLIGDPTSCEVAWQRSDLTGDPGLGTYTEDGKLGHGHIPLLAGSRAIDSGDDGACPPTDQLGQPRAGTCDIGAVEFQPLLPQLLAIRLNQSTFQPGHTLRVTLDLSNPGPILTTDVYVGVILPDGVNTLFLTNFSPLEGVMTTLSSDPHTFARLLRNVSWPAGKRATQQDYFTHTFTGLEPLGTYHFLVGWTKPNSLEDGRIDEGDVLALAWAPFTFTTGSTLTAKVQEIRARHATKE